MIFVSETTLNVDNKYKFLLKVSSKMLVFTSNQIL